MGYRLVLQVVEVEDESEKTQVVGEWPTELVGCPSLGDAITVGQSLRQTLDARAERQQATWARRQRKDHGKD